jgi:branched-chain amino acid transport system substrate-binding protein
MRSARSHRFGAVLAACAAAVVLAACGGSSKSNGSGGASSSGTSTPAASQSVLGTPKPASGAPVVFGMINDELNPGVTFTELRTAAEATAKYLNEYRGGIDGRPIKIDVCPTDFTPAVSTACANKLVAAHPVAILGGTDTAGAQTLPIYQRAKLAYLGGMNFTPAEASAPNSVIFNDAAQTGNIDLGAYAVDQLHAKKVAIIAQGDTQGKFTAQNFEVPGVTASGGQAKVFPLPPSQADASPVVASALAYKPDAIILESPGQCVAIINALKSLGNSKPVLSIDPCSAPNVIQATNGGAEGIYFVAPYQLYDGDTPDAKLARAIIAKYAPAKQVINSPALQGMNTVMNVWTAFHDTPVDQLNMDTILKKLKGTPDQPNFLSSPYTCNGQAVPAYPALCNAKQYVQQVKNGKLVIVSDQLFDAGAKIAKAPPKG